VGMKWIVVLVLVLVIVGIVLGVVLPITTTKTTTTTTRPTTETEPTLDDLLSHGTIPSEIGLLTSLSKVH